MVIMKAIACVLAAVFCGFLTIACGYLAYDAFAHADYLFGPLMVAAGACIAGLAYLCGEGAVTVMYGDGYKDGYEDGMHQCWHNVTLSLIRNGHSYTSVVEWLQMDTTIQMPKPCGMCRECLRYRLCEYPIPPVPPVNTTDWGSIHENTDTAKCLHPPLVKLGQGDYERNYPKSDD